MAKEAMVRDFYVGIGGVVMRECMSKLAMESLVVYVIPSVHGTRTSLRMMRSGPSNVMMLIFLPREVFVHSCLGVDKNTLNVVHSHL